MKEAENQMPAQKAVIYCRVWGAKQKKVGDGLSGHETNCR